VIITVCVYYCSTYYKAVCGGGGGNNVGHVLRETTNPVRVGTDSKNLFIGQYDKLRVLVIPDIIAFTISGMTDIIAISDI
jgi:hypothetical protein